jgi:hypothetical protein
MHRGQTLFSQVMAHVPHREFIRCVRRYGGDARVRRFTCWDQFLSLAFAQLTYRESLRDIEACLGAVPERLYHMGFRGAVSRSTLADANEKRDWRIYADFAQVLIHEARRLYGGESFGVDLEQTVYALDSTTIDLCLSLFPWAHFPGARRARSSCTRSWTCGGASRRSCRSPTAPFTMSTSWTSSSPSRARCT